MTPAHRIVDVLHGDDRLLNATQLAARLGVDRSWVYEHASDLGALRLGNGPRARLRFDPVTVAERLTGEPQAVARRTKPRASADLLPIDPPTHRRRRRTVR